MSFETLFRLERQLARFTGAPYVVVTDGCTHALELCFRLQGHRYCEFTAYTYLSIPQLMRQLDVGFVLRDEKWTGEYRFHGTDIWDSARLLRNGMYRPGQMQCLSFGHGKPLSVGKVGAILLHDPAAHQELSRMRSDGRDLNVIPWQQQQTFRQGYHYCPTLEDCDRAARLLPDVDQTPKYQAYPDLRTLDIASNSSV